MTARQYAAAALRWRHKEASCCKRAAAFDASIQQGQELACEVDGTRGVLDAMQAELERLTEHRLVALAELSLQMAKQ